MESLEFIVKHLQLQQPKVRTSQEKELYWAQTFVQVLSERPFFKVYIFKRWENRSQTELQNKAPFKDKQSGKRFKLILHKEDTQATMAHTYDAGIQEAEAGIQDQLGLLSETFKKKYKMASKRCLTLFIVREMDIETTVNFFTYLSMRMAICSWMNVDTQL